MTRDNLFNYNRTLKNIFNSSKRGVLDKNPFLLDQSPFLLDPEAILRSNNTSSTTFKKPWYPVRIRHSHFGQNESFHKGIEESSSIFGVSDKVPSTLKTQLEGVGSTWYENGGYAYSVNGVDNTGSLINPWDTASTTVDNSPTTYWLNRTTTTITYTSTTIPDYIFLNSSAQCNYLDFTPESLSLCILLTLIAVFTIFGNSLVIIAISRERYLHTVTNYFIMSLAVADCLVGTLVMPFSALYASFKCWLFGPDFCDVWHSFDVLASTASILNLCVISMDRYWAITDPLSYPSRMSPKKAYCFVALVWVCSSLISFPAIAWWRARSPPHPEYQCLFTEDLPYLFFSSTISFYGPLFVMVFTYLQIYRAATRQTRSLKLGQKLVSSMGNGDMELTLRIHRGGGGGVGGGGSTSSSGNGHTRGQSQKRKHCNCTRQNGHSRGGNGNSSDQTYRPILPTEDCDQCHMESITSGNSPPINRVGTTRNFKSFSISRKFCKFAKEKKAAKTLGIVMGVFIVCWLPFFVNNLRLGLCGVSCLTEADAYVTDVVTWLGWTNSAMNPVIYACMARDFRR